MARRVLIAPLMNATSLFDKVIVRQRSIFVANVAALVAFAGALLVSLATVV